MLNRAVSEPAAVIAGIGEPAEAGLHTIHRAEDLTILNVVWAPLMVLLPTTTRCGPRSGSTAGGKTTSSGSGGVTSSRRAGRPRCQSGGVRASHDAIHSVTNPIRRLTGAIHIYGGDFFGGARSEWDPETLRERPFDIEAARRAFREANERFKAIR